MSSTKFTKKQKDQEESYVIPYHYLDLFDASYKNIWSLEYLSYLRIVKSMIIGLKGGGVLIDAGCGDGRFIYEMANERAELIGIDYSSRAIDFAKLYNPNSRFIVSDLTKFRLYKKVDIVVFIETLEHMKPKAVNKVMKNIADVLKRKGIFILTVPTTNIPKPPKHYQHHTERSIKEALDPFFDVIEVYGHIRKGILRKLFFAFQIIGNVIYPLVKHFKPLDNYYVFLKYYFDHFLEKCEPRIAERLIVKAKRK